MGSWTGSYPVIDDHVFGAVMRFRRLRRRFQFGNALHVIVNQAQWRHLASDEHQFVRGIGRASAQPVDLPGKGHQFVLHVGPCGQMRDDRGRF